MSLYIDVKYINLISYKLEGFKRKSQDLYVCRCPLCGDSKKKKLKKRGYFFKEKDSMLFKCHNCNECCNVYKLLEIIDSGLAKEYRLEKYRKKDDVKIEIPKHTRTNIVIKPRFNIPKVSELDDTHSAKKYLIERKIPENFYSEFFYANDFKSFVLDVKPDYDKKLIDNDVRIIIPFRDFDKNIFAFQGRTLDKNNTLRYITVKLDEKEKIFGLDKINKHDTIYVTEGPIDSLFVKNCVATADSNLTHAAKVLDKNKLVLIPDVQPRNKEIVKNVDKFIEQGYNVSLLPESSKYKDINEMILSGISIEQCNHMIKDYTFSGMRLKIEFMKWKKI